MKNKILPLLAVILLVFTGLNVHASDSNEGSGTKICEKEENISFSHATIETKGEYITINFNEANTALDSPGKPEMPVCVKTFEFPIGTKIYDVECTHSEIKTEIISGKVEPAPQPVPMISLNQSIQNTKNEKTTEDKDVYSSSELYPDKWYEYSIGCGLDGTQHVLILTVRYYPFRYSPGENTLYYVENMDVKVSYMNGPNPLPAETKYNLVIITPRKFLTGVLPLAIHKNRIGVSTKIVTTESIYRKYNGRDKPEKIKYFIKDAIESWGITYVLLIGGNTGLGARWNVPVRYSNLEDAQGWNETYVSDLYYADIYKYNTSSHQIEFEDWDSNGNGIFAEWKWTWNSTGEYWTYPIVSKDIMDLYPDVYVGRLACRDLSEVRTVVKKIIKYENTANGKSWFKNMIVVGGDTVPYDGDNVYEGEQENEFAAKIMEPLGFNIDRIWVSNGRLTGTSDVVNETNKGAGFLYFSGHGNPIEWATHPFNNESAYIDVLFNFEMNELTNKNKLPICVVGGCHNSKLDVTPINMIKGILKYGIGYFTNFSEDGNYFGKSEWPLRCWSWNLIRQKNGGAIAVIGNTGLGFGVGGADSMNYQDGWVSSHFFETYNTSVLTDPTNCSLGLVHSQTLNKYIELFDPNNDTDDHVLDRKTVEEWILLGDPSLKIGGYPN